ncbi:MAG: hypothetical protein FWG36_10350 [Oscillospiraceae bacterium]|nr:hypothetical protein [Oscillospiraceae bacterium]
MKDYINKAMKTLGAYKYVLLVIAVGLILLLWPNAPPSAQSGGNPPVEMSGTGGSLEQTLENMLRAIEGVGRAELLLTDKGALVVCDGALDAVTRGKVLEAVSSVTNLSYDRISVIKMKNQKNSGGKENEHLET